MRLPTAVLLSRGSNGRQPQREHLVPFQELLPLRLKNRVSGKSDSNSSVACLQEMTVLFACLKDNDFVEQYCNKEITQFQKCYKSYQDTSFEAKRTENQGKVTPGKSLNYKQLNKYFRRYPNPV